MPTTITNHRPEYDYVLKNLIIKGRCSTCRYLIQENCLKWKYHRGTMQQYIELDTYCIICDVFKRLDGYCDMWEKDE